MTRFLPALALALLLAGAPLTAHAEETPKADDRVTLDLSAEDWVTTQTARVAINVEAAVTDKTAGVMRADMIKAVNDLVKTDWRLTEFNRVQDQTGLERWSAIYEARVPEAQLNGLGEAVKKSSKAGMQLSIGDIDFTPTLAEMESTRAALRSQIYKQANDQLGVLNAAIPGRGFRIAFINLTGESSPPMPQPMMMRQGRVMSSAMVAPAIAGGAP
ncbi:MAG: hypothetical protein M3N08_03225, partial [Pseudomonadota bacterium]|nr:hypothetical protein [Pseudomonadota bacterium]